MKNPTAPRSPLVVLLLALGLFLAMPAHAAEGERRVTTTSGEVYEGVIVERSSNHIVLRLDTGRLVELLQGQIDVIEVLSTGGSEAAPDRGGWSDEPERRYRRGPSDATEEDQPGVQLDGLDRPMLKARLMQADGGYALSVAPSIPSMITGMVLMISSPGTSGNFLWPGQFVGGMLLASASVVTAAAGADLTGRAAGLPHVSDRFGVGLGMAIAGVSMFTLSLGFTYGSVTGFLPYTGAEAYATPWLAGSGMGLLIAGNVILMADALASKEAISKRIRYRAEAPAKRIKPRFAGAGFGPNPEGGMSGSVSLTF